MILVYILSVEEEEEKILLCIFMININYYL